MLHLVRLRFSRLRKRKSRDINIVASSEARPIKACQGFYASGKSCNLKEINRLSQECACTFKLADMT
jgi:hypothetical protein